MSDSLAISVVSGAIKRRVLAAAQAAVTDANVRLGTPTAKLADDNDSLVNIHLYRVEPNAAHANTHLPSRSGAAQDLKPARLALDLHYVFSFYGKSEDYVPERMLANVMLAIEKVPLLTKATIDAAIADNSELAESDLAEAFSKVHLSRELMTIDDFSKVWSIFYQVPYALSLTYRASHVAIETEDVARLSLPVARPALWVAPLSKLSLDSISGDGRASSPVQWDALVRFVGSGLNQPGLGIAIDGIPLDIAGTTANSESLVVTLESARLGGTELTIGVHSARLLAPEVPGQPAHLRSGSESRSFALLPAISVAQVVANGGGATRNGHVELAIVPKVEETQSAVLVLDSRDPANPVQLRLDAKKSGVSWPADALEFPFQNLPTGSYLARLDVDGFVSPVSFVENPGQPDDGEIAGPMVAIT